MLTKIGENWVDATKVFAITQSGPSVKDAVVYVNYAHPDGEAGVLYEHPAEGESLQDAADRIGRAIAASARVPRWSDYYYCAAPVTIPTQEQSFWRSGEWIQPAPRKTEDHSC